MTLDLLGALAAGVILFAVAAHLLEIGFPAISAVVIVMLVGLPGGLPRMAVNDSRGIWAIAFLVLASRSYLFFLARGDVAAGLRAGLLLGLAAICNSAYGLFAITFAIGASLIGKSGEPRVMAEKRALAAVIAFPTCAAFAAVVFLNWRSGYSIVHFRGLFPAGSAWNIPVTVGAILRQILLSPQAICSIWLLAALRRRDLAAYLLLIPTAALCLWLSGQTVVTAAVVLLTCLAVLWLPGPLSMRSVKWVTVASMLQLVLFCVLSVFAHDNGGWHV